MSFLPTQFKIFIGLSHLLLLQIWKQTNISAVAASDMFMLWNHLKPHSLVLSFIGATHVFLLTYSFLILSFLPVLHIHLKLRNSAIKYNFFPFFHCLTFFFLEWFHCLTLNLKEQIIFNYLLRNLVQVEALDNCPTPACLHFAHPMLALFVISNPTHKLFPIFAHKFEIYHQRHSAQ